jgi:hypothetical protein
MLVEKQSEINKNPGGMARETLFFTCHPDGIPDRHDRDFLPT